MERRISDPVVYLKDGSDSAYLAGAFVSPDFPKAKFSDEPSLQGARWEPFDVPMSAEWTNSSCSSGGPYWDYPDDPSTLPSPAQEFTAFSEKYDDEPIWGLGGRCPECGRSFKDLKLHMLTHHFERPEKCPIATCEYHTKGFARKYDRCRHTLTHFEGTLVCDFCPASGTVAEKSFNRADVFKRHLTSTHGVEQNPPNSRRRTGTKSKTTRESAAGKCSTCNAIFNNAQDLYDHLDDCVLRSLELAVSPDVERADIDGEHSALLMTAKEAKGPVPAPLEQPTLSFDPKTLTRELNAAKVQPNQDVGIFRPEIYPIYDYWSGQFKSSTEVPTQVSKRLVRLKRLQKPSMLEGSRPEYGLDECTQLSDTREDVSASRNGGDCEGTGPASASEPRTTDLDMATVKLAHAWLDGSDQNSSRNGGEEIQRHSQLANANEATSNSSQVRQALIEQAAIESPSTKKAQSTEPRWDTPSVFTNKTPAASAPPLEPRVKEANSEGQQSVQLHDENVPEVKHATRTDIPRSLDENSSTYHSPLSEISDLTVTGELNTSTWSFVHELAKRIVSSCLDYHKAPFRSCNQSASTTGSTSSSSNANDTPATSQPSSNKRHKRGRADDGSGNGGEDEDDDSTVKKHKPSGSKSARLWACPFNKFDPMRYSEQNQSEKAYRKCASVTLTDISVVKQHLRRNHREPDFYCGRCYVKFDLKSQLLQHNKSDCAPAPEKYNEMMTDEQYKAIPKYLLNTPDSWYTIFHTLFRDAPRPASPYVAICDPATLQRFVELFRWIGPRDFLDLARDRREREPQSLELNVPLRMIIEETFGVAFPDYLNQLRDAMSQRPPSNVEPANIPPIPHVPTQRPVMANPESDSWDTSWHTDPEHWLQNPAQVDESFAMFDANLFGDTYIPTRPFM